MTAWLRSWIGLAVAVALAATPTAAAAASRATVIPGAYIVVYHHSLASPSAKTAALERKEGFKARLRYGTVIKGFAAHLSATQLARVKADPAVAFVAPDRAVHATGVPLATGETVPSGIRRMGGFNGGTVHGASSADVAVIDTGVDLANTDLNVSSGTNCVKPGTTAQDDNGHGTHVAGTIGARNNGTRVVGVAPGTKIYAVKVLDSGGSGTASQVICGINWVASTRTDSNPSNDIAVANMSLGGTGPPLDSCPGSVDAEHVAICNATDAGVTFVVAAGNSGWDYDYAPAPDVPAAYPEVLTVTAVSDSDGKPGAAGGAPTCRTGEVDDRYASFSNYAATAGGQAHTIAAPGVCITSDRLGGGTTVLSGTSMATPHETGAVALCIGESGTPGACASLAPPQVVQQMRTDAATYNNANTGFGFTGDPLRPVSGAYFGYLTSAYVPDTAPPTVTSVSPANGAVGVSTTTTLTATFSEPMDTTATQGAFTLVRTSDGASVPGTFTWKGNQVTFKPSVTLQEGTSYTATISTAARDAAGNTLASPKTWSFTTWRSVTAFPFATTVLTGSPVSGDYTSLTADDNVYYALASTTTGTPTVDWYGQVDVDNGLKSLKLTYRAKASATCSQTLQVYNWRTAAWTQFDARNVGTNEVQVDKNPGGTLADWVSGTSGVGELQFRVTCTTASAAFTTSGDLMRVIYTIP